MILIAIMIIKNQRQNTNNESVNQEKKSSSILCSSINLKNTNPLIEISGRINSSNKINIISEVNGISNISNSKFEIGEEFKKGEILISIKDDHIDLELKSVKSQFLALLVQVLPDIKMDFPSLGNKFQTYINNFSLDKKIGNLPTTTSSKQRNFLSSRQVFANYYTIKALENRLDKFKIRAPFDGILTKALIDPGSNVIIGQPLGEFINPNDYEIGTSVSVKEANLMKIGNKVIISSNDLKNEIKAVVSRIGSHINELTQSIDVFISIENKEVKDGMYVSGKIICDEINNIYKIERSKIIENKIYVLKNDTIKMKAIEIISFQNDSAIIKGIDENDCIVNQYRHYLYDGMPMN